MRNYVQRLCECKLGKFFIKYHIFYLILPIALWGFKALSYNIAIWIDPPTRYFHFTIDDKIPFIKYFFVFYFSYYFVPPIFLWILSFYDKEKVIKILLSLFVCVCISFIFYCNFNVVMKREYGYPNGITFTDIKDISTFFDFCINWIYKKDLEAMNCFPSLHAIVGMCLVSIGAYIPKLDKKGLPKAFRISSIIIGIGCILSTIFIKQHYFIDMIAGVILEVVSLGSLYIAFELYAKTKRKSGSCKEKGEEV